MIHYNSNNNACCRAVNAETFHTIEHNPVRISILLYTRKPYSYSHFEIIICIYSVRGDIDQMSTNTSSYTICSAPNVYIFVYILIETRYSTFKGFLRYFGNNMWPVFTVLRGHDSPRKYTTVCSHPTGSQLFPVARALKHSLATQLKCMSKFIQSTSVLVHPSGVIKWVC